MACSYVATFKLIDDPAGIMLYQDNLRKELIGLAMTVPRIGLQRILQVVRAKPLIESRVGKAFSNAEYARECHEHITYSVRTEAMSGQFVKMARSAYRKPHRQKEIQDVVFDLENVFGERSGFLRVAATYAAANKCDGLLDLIEYFELIAFFQKMGQIDSSDFPDAKLFPKSGQKGTLDYVLAKIHLKHYLSDQWMESCTITAKAATIASPANES